MFNNNSNNNVFYSFEKDTYRNWPTKAKKIACPWDQADQNLNK